MMIKEEKFQDAFNHIRDCTDLLQRAFDFLHDEDKETDIEIDLHDALTFAQKLTRSIQEMVDQLDE